MAGAVLKAAFLHALTFFSVLAGVYGWKSDCSISPLGVGQDDTQNASDR